MACQNRIGRKDHYRVLRSLRPSAVSRRGLWGFWPEARCQSSAWSGEVGTRWTSCWKWVDHHSFCLVVFCFFLGDLWQMFIIVYLRLSIPTYSDYELGCWFPMCLVYSCSGFWNRKAGIAECRVLHRPHSRNHVLQPLAAGCVALSSRAGCRCRDL